MVIYEATGAKRLTYHKYRGLGSGILSALENVPLAEAHCVLICSGYMVFKQNLEDLAANRVSRKLCSGSAFRASSPQLRWQKHGDKEKSIFFLLSCFSRVLLVLTRINQLLEISASVCGEWVLELRRFAPEQRTQFVSDFLDGSGPQVCVPLSGASRCVLRLAIQICEDAFESRED